MNRTWVDLGFYAIDNAIPIITALGALVAAAGTVATTILAVLNRTHLARQDIAIADVPARVAESAATTVVYSPIGNLPPMTGASLGKADQQR